MTSEPRDPVRFTLRVFSPLLVGANATSLVADYSIWIWYTDVELFGASTVQPQSARVRKKGAPANQEERPLSTWLSASSKLANSLSGIPFIGSVTGPSAVWLKYASGLAHSFGFSRPVESEPIRSMAPHYMSSLPNSDGLANASVLAANKDARARLIDDYSPSGMDEMSLAFIKKQWSFFGEFPFRTSDAQGVELLNLSLAPGLGTAVVAGFGTAFTSLGYLSFLSRFYRGGMEICFKFIKTGFHAGSLQFSYEIGRNGSATSVTVDQTSVLHRTIVDIQQGDSVCLAFPFVCSADFLETYESFGRVRAHVINALVAPETVAPSVMVQMYIRGMDDLEFSGISNQNGVTPVVREPIVVPQGGDVEKREEIVCEPIGNALMMQDQSGIQMMDSMSESWTSLLQMAKISNQIQFRMVPNDEASIAFNPAAWVVTTQDASDVVQRLPFAYCNLLNSLRSCYAYQRGGYEFNIVPPYRDAESNRNYIAWVDYNFGSPPTFEVTTSSSIKSTETTLPTAGIAARDFHFRTFKAANSGQYGLSVYIPYKNRFRVSLIYPYTQDAGIGTLGGGSLDFTDRTRLNFIANTGATAFLRAGEDFQLLYWVGVPCMRNTS